MRDHGGNIHAAIGYYGGTNWIKLLTAINCMPCPVPDISNSDWAMLPIQAAKSAVLAAGSLAYRTDAQLLATAGAQAAVQMIPRLMQPWLTRALSPTYNERAAALRAAGWSSLGGTELSRLYETPDDETAQVRLVRKLVD